MSENKKEEQVAKLISEVQDLFSSFRDESEENFLNAELKQANRKIAELESDVRAILKFCDERKYNMSDFFGNLKLSPYEMTREQLLEANRAVDKSQATKLVRSAQRERFPSYDQQMKQYEEQSKNIDPVAKYMLSQLERELRKCYFAKIMELDPQTASCYDAKWYLDMPLKEIEAFVKKLEDKKKNNP